MVGCNGSLTALSCIHSWWLYVIVQIIAVEQPSFEHVDKEYEEGIPFSHGNHREVIFTDRINGLEQGSEVVDGANNTFALRSIPSVGFQLVVDVCVAAVHIDVQLLCPEARTNLNSVSEYLKMVLIV